MGRTRIVRGLILVLSVVSPGCAASVYAEVGAPEAEVVLEAGQIDSRTVAAGARVVVVHGRGERHPISGEWARLDTAAGYVQAVDGETLVLAREGDLRHERIPLDRIERVVIGGTVPGPALTDSRSFGGVRSNTVASLMGSGRRERGGETELRILAKLGAGALGGFLLGYTGFAVGYHSGEGDILFDGDVAAGLRLGMAGYVVGTAAGVSWAGPHDGFIPTLGGSAVGMAVGLLLTKVSPDALWPALYAGPIAGATKMSEWSRDPPEDAGISLGLSPTPGRGFSVAAALRF